MTTNKAEYSLIHKGFLSFIVFMQYHLETFRSEADRLEGDVQKEAITISLLNGFTLNWSNIIEFSCLVFRVGRLLLSYLDSLCL